jgi:DNA adenine methylase
MKYSKVKYYNQQMSTKKPFLKWIGGKTQIIDKIMDMFPTTMNDYHEPFLGGGSVLLALLSYIEHGKIHVDGTIYASDLNQSLINLYKTIQFQPNELIIELKNLVAEFSLCENVKIDRKAKNLTEALSSQESYYFWIRARFNRMNHDNISSPLTSAMMLFLNKTCFRGMYREGPNGFNVPFGNYKNPSIFDDEHLLKISGLIKNVVFTHESFTESLSRVKCGDFLYLDPPYAPECSTSFVSYTNDGFDIENHRLLFEKCNKMDILGIRFLLSNSNVPMVNDAFSSPQYTRCKISCRHAINSKKPDSRADEILISN